MKLNIFRKKQDSTMIQITKSGLINSLKKINHPAFDVNHITLNSIKKIESQNGNLFVELSLPVSQESVNEIIPLFTEVIKKDFSGINDVKLNIQAKQSQTISEHKDPKKDAILPGV